MNEVERVARAIAAEKMGLVKDPFGHRLPDDLWKQALPQAMIECETQHMSEENAARDEICDEILRIMRTYHEQEASSYGVDTPGGLEHMGDVWKLFHRWEDMLTGAARRG